MKNADMVMNGAFWIGVYPGINGEMLTYVKKAIAIFMAKYDKIKRNTIT